MNVQQVVALNIARFRGWRRMSQECLADRLALHRTAITKIEVGARDVTIAEAVAIAEALGITLAQLVDPDAIPPSVTRNHERGLNTRSPGVTDLL